jgi:hypothetical protein
VAGIPFVAVDLQVSVNFPNDRLLLPYMFGGALLVTTMLHHLLPAKHLNWVSSVLIGFAAGGQIITASAYQQDWENQAAFFEQLAWRAPGIQAGTALLSEELPFQFSTDNSLTPPLNSHFAPNFSGGNLPLILLNLENRLGTKVAALEPGRAMEIDSFRSVFFGTTDQVLVIQYSPPACLRVLHPTYDRFLPGTSELIDKALQLSRPEQIIDTRGASGVTSAHSWCEYFQLADLARQAGDWDEIVRLGELAFALSDSPNDANERLPFLEGYAMSGDYDFAVALTLETIRIDKRSTQLLCAAWARIEAAAPDSDTKSAALQLVEEELSCNVSGN